MQELLLKQNEEESRKKSQKIKRLLFKLKEFKKAKLILFYLSFKGEVNTLAMIKEALKKGKKIAIPICDKKTKKIIPCQIQNLQGTLEQGCYGILEPKKFKPIDLSLIDLVIVPGLVFDKLGNRLGRGLGYYDRFLAKIPENISRIGLAFDFQIISRLPYLESHDIPLNRILFA